MAGDIREGKPPFSCIAAQMAFPWAVGPVAPDARPRPYTLPLPPLMIQLGPSALKCVLQRLNGHKHLGDGQDLLRRTNTTGCQSVQQNWRVCAATMKEERCKARKLTPEAPFCFGPICIQVWVGPLGL